MFMRAGVRNVCLSARRVVTKNEQLSKLLSSSSSNASQLDGSGSSADAAATTAEFAAFSTLICDRLGANDALTQLVNSVGTQMIGMFGQDIQNLVASEMLIQQEEEAASAAASLATAVPSLVELPERPITPPSTFADFTQNHQNVSAEHEREDAVLMDFGAFFSVPAKTASTAASIVTDAEQEGSFLRPAEILSAAVQAQASSESPSVIFEEIHENDDTHKNGLFMRLYTWLKNCISHFWFKSRGNGTIGTVGNSEEGEQPASEVERFLGAVTTMLVSMFYTCRAFLASKMRFARKAAH